MSYSTKNIMFSKEEAEKIRKAELERQYRAAMIEMAFKKYLKKYRNAIKGAV